jgi:hypothetical protein
MSEKELNEKREGLKKMKFHENGLSRDLEINRIIFVPGILPTTSNHQSNNIDIETSLLHPENTYDKKNKIILDTDKDNKGEDYRNFTIASEDTRENLDYSKYINNGFKGNGRGFGDYEIGSDLRYGQNSRLEKNHTRQTDLTNIKFNNSDIGLNETGNYVLPFPRGGIDTRNLDKNRIKK